MKDVVIKAGQIKRELIVLAILFGVAVLMNIYAILAYNGGWSEIFSQLHIVIALTVFLYLLIAVIRLIVLGIRKLGKKETTENA